MLPRNRLVLDLRMNEGAGVTLADSSDYRHSLTVRTSTTRNVWAGSERGWTQQFFGGGWCTTSGPIRSLAGLSELTVIMWVKSFALTDKAFVTHWLVTGNQRSWALMNGALNANRMRVLVSQDGTVTAAQHKDYTSSLNVFDNFWHHAAFSFHGPSSTLSLYVDGRIDHNPTKTQDGTIRSVFVPNADVALGAFSDFGNPMDTGQIESVRIWNRALSQQEIRKDFADTRIVRV